MGEEVEDHSDVEDEVELPDGANVVALKAGKLCLEN